MSKEPKTSYHHGHLRAALIKSGLELIEDKGVHAFTLREIGSQIGVSRSAAYRHFKDKASLLAAIVDAGFTEFSKVLQEARNAAEKDFASQMDSMALAYFRFANEHKTQFEVMVAAVLEFGVVEVGGGQNLKNLEDMIRDGQQTGEVRQGDPVLLARVVWSLVHGACMLRLDGNDAEPAFIRLCTEVLRSGLINQQATYVPPESRP